MEKIIKAYKGFNPDFTCRGFQYEVGKDYEMDDKEIECCESGFHACEFPLEVLDHYFLVGDKCEMARFAEVEQSGTISPSGNGDTKMASSKIKIKAELKFADLVKVGIDWLMEKTRPVSGKKSRNNDGGENSAQMASSGDYAKMASSGNSAQMASSGYYAQMASSGYSAQMASSGNYAKMASSGNSAQMASSGYYAKMASSGNYAKMASSGYSAQMASSGDYAKMASSGDYAKMASSGDYAKMASSGDSAKMASSGYSAKMASSGDYAKMASEGEDAVICCAGHDSRVKAKTGSWITLAEWSYDDKKGRNVPVMVKTIRIDGETYKPDTWYRMKDGEIVEA